MNSLERQSFYNTAQNGMQDEPLTHDALNFRIASHVWNVRDIFSVRVEVPRYVIPGDVVSLPITVTNHTKLTLYAKISLSSEDLMLNEEVHLPKIIPYNQNVIQTVKGYVLGGAKYGTLNVTTSWGTSKSTQKITIPVHQPWDKITLSGTGTFRPGVTELDIPIAQFKEGDVTGSLTLANTPAVAATQAVEFLNTYPYGCLEQTVSCAWPFLILPDAVAELDPLITTDTALRERTDGAINRIQSMQLYDGSFASWPGTNTPYNWGSVYAAHFLLSAKNAGVSFPDEMLTGAMTWMRQFLASMPSYSYDGEEQDDLTTKAYAVYVLALNGERPLGWIEYLRENMSSLRPSGHVYLAGAQSLIDGNADALKTLELGRNSGYSGVTLESETRNTATLLTMWLDVDPQAPEVTELANRLVTLCSDGSWFSTQDNSSAIVALARYNVEAAGAKSDIRARVTTETSDKALLTYNNETASMKVSDLPSGSSILIEAEGNGQGCYSWSITGFPKTQPRAERRNINVECVYFDEKGNAIDITQPIMHGSVIQAVLTVKPSMTVNNLALNYLLPAGFELENPRLDDDGASDQPGSYGIVNDVRDDRLVLFFDRLTGERSYGFKMRAVTRGKFRVPQVSAFGLYDAGVRFTGPVQPNIEVR